MKVCGIGGASNGSGLSSLSAATVAASVVPCIYPGSPVAGRCVCTLGALGEDCGLEDRGTARAKTPYGLRYPNQELTLIAGVPLALSPGLVSWPVAPWLISAPDGPLRFETSPQLPRGLAIAQDGTLFGIPLLSVSRGPYTIRVSTGSGAASAATMFISVACPAIAPDCTPQEPLPPSVSFTSSELGFSTASNNTRPIFESTRLLRLHIGRQFAALEAEPGLERFVLLAAGAAAAAASVTAVAVTHMLAIGSSGRTQINFRIVEHVEDVGMAKEMFEAAAFSFFSEMRAEDSSLRTSSFGREYLGDAMFFEVGDDGILQRWPPLDDSDPRLWVWIMDTYGLFIGGGWVFVHLVWVCYCRRQINKAHSRLVSIDWSATNSSIAASTASRTSASGSSGRAATAAASAPAFYRPPVPSAADAAATMGAVEARADAGLRPAPRVVGAATREGQVSENDQHAAMSQLLDMGFEFDAAHAALVASDWNVSRAAAVISAQTR